MTNADDLTELTATEALTMMRQGDVAAERYAAALLARCEARRSLNAFITLEPERVLEAARAADGHRASGKRLAPLHGLPIPVKDSVNTKDYPTTGGTPALRGFQPSADAAIVRQLVDAGAIIMGKTNIHELSFGWTSNNLAFGAVRNPYDPTRIPGGSSGGTAAAVAARMAPLGIAEDTQGSIRVPAALCGICGFRPTTGRYPNEGVVPITPLFDQVGPHARSVGDLELFDTIATGDIQPPGAISLQGVRLGIDRGYFFESLDDEVARLCGQALDRLVDAGAILVEAPVPRLAELIGLTTAQVQLYDVMPRLIEYLQRYRTDITFERLMAQASPDIQATFSRYVLPGGAGTVPEADFVAARDTHLPALRRTMAAWLREHELTAIVFPATRIPATVIGGDEPVEIGGRLVSFQSAISRNISPGSTAGVPGLVLPAGLTSHGLPVAVELDGHAGLDRELLALGRAVEGVLGVLPPP
jgi:mandelamide amidase